MTVALPRYASETRRKSAHQHRRNSTSCGFSYRKLSLSAAHNGLVAGSSPAGPTNKISNLFGMVRDHRTRNAPFVYAFHALATARLVLHFVADQALVTSIVDSAGTLYEMIGLCRI